MTFHTAFFFLDAPFPNRLLGRIRERAEFHRQCVELRYN